MRRILCATLTLLFFAGGCVRHEPVHVSVVETPDHFMFARDAADEAVTDVKWWLAFADEQLNGLMNELFSQNLELVQMYARLDQVEALVSSSRSARLPNLTAAGKTSRSRQPGVIDDFQGNSGQLSLQAGYEVDLWGKLASLEQASRLDYEASRQELSALMLGLSARLADLYFLVCEQNAQIRLADQLIASFAQTLERVERRYRQGLTGAVDLYQSRQSLTAARASRHLYESGLASAEHAISVLLGRYPDVVIEDKPDYLPEPPALFPVGIPAGLIHRRPDLRAALKRVAAADHRVAATIADRFPSISLSGSMGSLRQDVTGGLISGSFWNLLGSFAMPVIDGGRRRAEVRRHEAILAEMVAGYQQKVLVAFQDVEDALANNYANAKRVELLEETAQATSATLRLSTERYLSGLTDYLPVLTAQRNHVETQSRLLAAKKQVLTDRVSLARALGGTWMMNEMNNRLQINKDSIE